ncbi:hypothetical protein LWI28_008429 [Acer negundo]|uniref:Uncharacterized protein n=1 Tax=Acer negundo TaxID=4023 RepID=A0AAD5I5Y1_ACENE|nr:hypothetical protein LWI28_008429 [Acer negundo]
MVMKEKEIMAIGMMIGMAEMETHIVVGETMKTAMASMVTEMMIPMEEAEVLIVTKIAQAGTPIDTVLLVMTVNHHVEMQLNGDSDNLIGDFDERDGETSTVFVPRTSSAPILLQVVFEELSLQ